jgi:hypothetical protein
MISSALPNPVTARFKARFHLRLTTLESRILIALGALLFIGAFCFVKTEVIQVIQEFRCLLRNKKVRRHTPKNPLVFPSLSQNIPNHTFSTYFFNITF